jgi:hypothetical protein
MQKKIHTSEIDKGLHLEDIEQKNVSLARVCFEKEN